MVTRRTATSTYPWTTPADAVRRTVAREAPAPARDMPGCRRSNRDSKALPRIRARPAREGHYPLMSRRLRALFREAQLLQDAKHAFTLLGIHEDEERKSRLACLLERPALVFHCRHRQLFAKRLHPVAR